MLRNHSPYARSSTASSWVLFAVSAAMLITTNACSSSSSLPKPNPNPSRIPPGYQVGVDYHSYGANFASTTFLTIYQQPGVRQTVRAQLQGMADHGATVTSLHIWFAHDPTDSNVGATWESTFPMSDQEEANLRTYAQDVAAVRGMRGNRLRLDICMGWDNDADFTIGSPTTGLGNAGYSASEYTSRAELSIDKVLAAVSNVTRPDGIHIVGTIYLNGGVSVGDTPNEDWFLTTLYPHFVTVVSGAGFQPSVYFSVCCTQDVVLDNSYVDPQYPVLNGHRSVAPLYRTLKFMVDHGMYIPPRIDFGYYVLSTGATYQSLLTRVLNDADATLPSLGVPKSYGVAETYYPADSSTRRQYGQAFADEARAHARLTRVSIWTTPNSGFYGENAAYPFAIEDYLYP